MDELTDFDIVSYETNENMFQIDSVNKSTQVNQVRNQIYLILHDNKCYGYTHDRQNAKNIINKIANDQVKSLRQNYPDLKIFYDDIDTKNKIYEKNLKPPDISIPYLWI